MCLFCEIVGGRVDADIVHEDATTVAFLDIHPVFLGHTLVVPRAHYETISDVPSEALGPIFANVQKLARAVEAGLDAEGTFLAANNRVSQTVPHLHVHVIPRRRKDGLRGFFWPRQKYESAEARRDVAASIRRALAGSPRPLRES